MRCSQVECVGNLFRPSIVARAIDARPQCRLSDNSPMRTRHAKAPSPSYIVERYILLMLCAMHARLNSVFTVSRLLVRKALIPLFSLISPMTGSTVFDRTL